jgi:hypothetical protein
MADTQINEFDTEITFEPLYVTAGPMDEDADIARIREILRPLVMDLLIEEYDVVRRMMGG